MVEELTVQSSLCPSPRVVDKSMQVQRRIQVVCEFISTGVWCPARLLHLPRGPQSTSKILQLLSAVISLAISCCMWCLLSGC